MALSGHFPTRALVIRMILATWLGSCLFSAGLDDAGAVFLNKDFLPSSISRGGAFGTYFESPTATYYNPAASSWVPKTKMAVTLSHAFLPDDVYLQYLSLYLMIKEVPLYFSVLHFTTALKATGKNNEDQGEFNPRSLMFNLSSGGKIGKELSWGGTFKFLTSRYYVNNRNFLAVDMGVMLNVTHFRAYAALRNLGLDLAVVGNFLGSPSNPPNVNTASAQSVVPLPLTFAIGGQYRLFRLFRIYGDVEYYVIDSLVGSGLAAFRPKIGLSFEPVPELSLNSGWNFRNEQGIGYPSFGIDVSFKINKLPIGVEYAIELIPDFAFNHYFGVILKFD